mgnify:CR=1 FL=1
MALSAPARKPIPANLNQAALERLITDRALLEQAKRLGIDADATAIEREELKLASQQSLSLDALHRKLRAEGTSVEQLRRDLREQLVHGSL